MMDKLLNQKEVAALLGLSTAWLERKRWEGGGIPYIKVGRAVRYYLRDVTKYLDDNWRK